LFSGNSEAYAYLPDSVLKFPDGERFLNRLSDAGFSQVKEKRLSFGIATIYTGIKEEKKRRQ